MQKKNPEMISGLLGLKFIENFNNSPSRLHNKQNKNHSRNIELLS